MSKDLIKALLVFGRMFRLHSYAHSAQHDRNAGYGAHFLRDFALYDRERVGMQPPGEQALPQRNRTRLSDTQDSVFIAFFRGSL